MLSTIIKDHASNDFASATHEGTENRLVVERNVIIDYAWLKVPNGGRWWMVEMCYYIIVTMNNFNRRNSHGHHGSKRREVSQDAHSHGSHAFTHTLYISTVTTTWCEAPAQLLCVSACWVFSRFRNPPNSDMAYRVLNVRT